MKFPWTSRSTSTRSPVDEQPTASRGHGAEGTETGSSRNSVAPETWLASINIDETSRYKAIIKFLHARLLACQWISSTADSPAPCHGLLLRRSRGVYISEPEIVNPLLLAAVQALNVEVAFTMSTESTRIIASSLQPDQTEVVLPSGSQLQVIDSIRDLSSSPPSLVKKFQYAALLREEHVLLVWHDRLENILDHVADLEERLLALVCGTSLPFFSTRNRSVLQSQVTSPGTSTSHLSVEPVEKYLAVSSKSKAEEASKTDMEAAPPAESLDRPLALTSAIFVGLAMCLMIVLLLGFGISNLVFQTLIDGGFIRMALIITVPFFLLLSMFFFVVLFTDLFQAAGPIKTLQTNSRFYSAVRPNLNRAWGQGFTPHGSPSRCLYTRSHWRVSSYRQFEVSKKPSLIMSPMERGWIRPERQVQKASNMNFALNVSNRVEDEMLHRLAQHLSISDLIDPAEEAVCYQRALEHVLESDLRIHAGGDIRIGELILIVDSDTRVPVDCLLHGAVEMYLSPEVAIVQHATGVMQVSWDYFENGIAFFTNLIYSAIQFSVGSGETAPFRCNPSAVTIPMEDFDLALRLQIAGNVIRLANYHHREFKEGVSLTIYDELARWEKYAYGCNELVFNPLRTWLWRGPCTRLFMTFLWSNLQLSSKLTILGYISSYYAIASGFPLSILNYFLVGWFNGYLDKFYMESWKIFLSLIIVFSGFGNVTLAIIRYRLGEKSLGPALLENFKWMPMFAIFFGGLSFHLSRAILAHMFSINMQWGTTAKEKINSNFFKEMPKIFQTFKWLYAVLLPLVLGMIYLGCFAPGVGDHFCCCCRAGVRYDCLTCDVAGGVEPFVDGV
ncbi:glycosyltransferase family 2 protein [Aspergillus tanneri]|uniref:Glycosyltransferase 2-like domain-containing protein n=1 Tax=Aspergillus tanneri TaxID=1220188 RepID=A0A5M9MI35_9EURO|nr:uncharacterized protein ATNIH1004_005330 [Aspergillus tanneri]KAA8646655.1 hypothetical protein ATNIH1004_005330 [Aspergillus tanneri]